MKRPLSRICSSVSLAVGLAVVLWLCSQGFTAADVPLGGSDVACTLVGGKPEAIHGLDYSRDFKGFTDCARCHASGDARKVLVIDGVEVDLAKERWITYGELATWQKEDKHRQAFAVLHNDRSKKMGEILRTEVYRDKRCLACHTGFPVARMEAEKDSEHLVSAKAIDKLDVRFGVTCEGCHGPSVGVGKELAGWYSPHQESDSWRFLAPETKRKDYGFWDVRSPSTKTKMCASCHIGSVEHGRVLTHEMYAAGHPPLPAFEVETFVDQMPAHWEQLKDKNEDAVKTFLKRTKDPIYRDGAYRKDYLNRSRALLVGSLVSTSEYFRLIADLTDEAAKGATTKPEWPELAAFDCYACHHELKGDSWRQARKPPAGVPGRPFLQEWHGALVPVALDRVEGAPKEYAAKFEAVRQALNKQPFGQREELKNAARAAADWLWGQARELERKPLPPDAGLDLVKDVVGDASSSIRDYESARHFIWAYQVIDRETKRPGSAAIDAKLAPMAKDMFLLSLREGRKATTSIPGEKGMREIMEVDLGLVLPFIANYDPTRFREKFLEVKGLLK